MIDKVQITISAYNFQKLCRLHDEWQRSNHSMAEQDVNYMIGRLIDIAQKEDERIEMIRLKKEEQAARERAR